MLVFTSLIILAMVVASIPLLLLVPAVQRPLQRLIVKSAGAKLLIISLIIVVIILSAKILLVFGLDLLPSISVVSKSSAEVATLNIFSLTKSQRKGYSKPYKWQALPSAAPYPQENPQTPDKIALGRKLFHDRNLSIDGTVACTTCHSLQLFAGADGKKLSLSTTAQKQIEKYCILGTTREVIARLLGELTSLSLIRTGRGKVKLKNTRALSELLIG